MNNIYYKIVNDAYYKIKYGPNPDLWKLGIVLVISIPQTFFFIWIMAIIERNTFVFYELIFLNNYFLEPISSIIELILLYITPIVLLNYYLIIYDEKYKKIVNEENYKNGIYLKFYWIFLITPILLHLISFLFK